MSVVAPPRPPDLEPIPESDRLDALIEEARRRTRRRRRRYAGGAMALVAVGAIGTAIGWTNWRSGGSVDSRAAPVAAVGKPFVAGGGTLTVIGAEPNAGEGWFTAGTVQADGGLEPVARCPDGVGWCGTMVSIDWSPDGRRFALSVTSYGLDNPYNGLHVIDVATGRDRMLYSFNPRDGDRADLDWSPNGSTIAYASDDGIQLLAVDGNSASRRLITGDRPSWSPDGTKIAFSRIGRDGRRSIRVIGVDASRAHTLVPRGTAPEWSPDGEKIAYRQGCKILMVSPAGRDVTPPKLRQCIDFPGPTLRYERYIGAPVWSPDGTKLAFISNAHGALVMNADGTGLRRVTTPTGWDGRPTWRPLP